MVAAGAVIENTDTGKILILQRADDLDWHAGEWEIDYGRLDQFEDPISGLKREIFEETGLKDIQIGQILSVWHIFRGPQTAENELIGITYHCTTTEINIYVSEEHSGYQWVQPEQALELIKVDGIRRDIKIFMEMKTGHGPK